MDRQNLGQAFHLQSSRGSSSRALSLCLCCAWTALLRSCVVSFCCSICSPLEQRAGKERDPPSLLSSEPWQPVQDILGSAFPVLGDGQISPHLPASALPPKSSPCHNACWKIPTPFQHIKTPKSHEFPFNLHPECLCWERESCRLRDSATTVAGEAEEGLGT